MKSQVKLPPFVGRAAPFTGRTTPSAGRTTPSAGRTVPALISAVISHTVPHEFLLHLVAHSHVAVPIPHHHRVHHGHMMVGVIRHMMVGVIRHMMGNLGRTRQFGREIRRLGFVRQRVSVGIFGGWQRRWGRRQWIFRFFTHLISLLASFCGYASQCIV
jgi:hypothetical protein